MSEASPLVWTDDGQPRSRLYGDIYFSLEDGLQESRAVFLQGCGLPEAWRGRDRFVVGELGFGSGLNILALMDLWRREGPADGRLHVFSVEAHPMTAQDAARALSPWPELADLAERLVARWPGRARGVHRIEMPEARAVIDLAVMDVVEALAGWTGRADAWFLDGFSPALNPQMWRQEVLDAVGAHAAPGCRLATFTVAGAVRRGLEAAGFQVAKRPGFGRKRERLEAWRPDAPEPAGPTPRVAVIGAGIAGAAMARALRAVGVAPQLFHGRGEGGSGNPSALVTPRLDAGLGPPSRLFAQAFARAVQLYSAEPDATIARGVLQLAAGDRDPRRFATLAASDLFEPGALRLLTAEEASARLGEPVPEALEMTHALVIDPAPVLAAWRGDAASQARVERLERTPGGWRLLDAAGADLGSFDAVVLACAQDAARLHPDLPLTPVRGQASWSPETSVPAPAAWGGYAAPLRQGLLFGATHDRGDAGEDLREEDHRRNLAALAQGLPKLAEQLAGRPLDGRAAVRATTPDRLPIAGVVAEGLYALTGFGSRGFAMAPLLAEHLAAQIAGDPSPLPAPLAELVAPDRFARRAARRSPPA